MIVNKRFFIEMKAELNNKRVKFEKNSISFFIISDKCVFFNDIFFKYGFFNDIIDFKKFNFRIFIHFEITKFYIMIYIKLL